MAEFTFLELHFENADLTANAPYSYGEKDVDAGKELPDEGGSSKKGAILAVLIGLAFCAAVAYAIRGRIDDDEGSETDV